MGDKLGVIIDLNATITRDFAKLMSDYEKLPLEIGVRCKVYIAKLNEFKREGS